MLNTAFMMVRGAIDRVVVSAAILPALALLAAIVFASPAHAQGTMGAMPDPISSRELQTYADRLNLSDYQRQAAAQFHDQYQAEFRVLRDTEIEKFLSESRNLERAGMGFAMGMGIDRKAIDKALREYEDILSKIRNLDNRLFDQMQVTLADDQAPNMQRVRQARERTRYRSGLSGMTRFLNQGTQVDLSEIVDDLDLSPQELANVDPLLAQYETVLTQHTRKVHEMTGRLVTEALDRVEAMGLTPEGMADPERRGQMFEQMRNAWVELSAKLVEQTAVITDHNRRSARTLATALEADNARILRREFLQRGYPETVVNAGALPRAFDESLKFDELTAEQRESVLALATSYYASFDQLTEQMVDLIDENRKTRSVFDFNRDARRAFDEKIDDLRAKRTALNDSTRESLKAALGEELSEKLAKRVAEGDDDRDGRGGRGRRGGEFVGRVAGGPGGGGRLEIGAVMAGGQNRGQSDSTTEFVDPYLPTPISKRDLDVYATQLGLGDDGRSILSSLHSDYVEKFKAIEENEIKAVREAEKTLWTADASGNMQPPTAQAIDKLYELRLNALNAIEQLDSTFIGDLQATLVTADDAGAVARVKSSRQRDVFNRTMAGMGFRGGRGGPWGGGGGGGGRRGQRGGFGAFMGAANEASIDLADIIAGLELDAEQRKAIDPSLVEYEQAAAEAFRKMYETALRQQQARDKVVAEMAANRGGERDRDRFQNAFFGNNDETSRNANQAREAVATLNRGTLTRLNEALPPHLSHQLTLEYNKKAYPNIYDDSRSAERPLAEALELSDLTDEQRLQIQQIAAEYRGAYHDLCDKLVRMQSALPDFTRGFDRNANRDWQAIQQTLRDREKIEFDRDELSDKAIMRLKALLNESQVQRLGGLRIAEAN